MKIGSTLKEQRSPRRGRAYHANAGTLLVFRLSFPRTGPRGLTAVEPRSPDRTGVDRSP